jgi:RNA polymerase primary sigma factor
MNATVAVEMDRRAGPAGRWGPRLSASEERVLTRRAVRGESEAVGRLIQSNLPFVVLVAREYRGLGLPLEDLIEEGALGLMEALGRFDPSRGLKFMTYAVWWVRRCIVRALSKNSSIVRVPRYRSKQFKEARAAFNSLAGRLGRAPGADEVAEALGVEPEEAELRLQSYPTPVSLDRPLRDGDHTTAYYFADTRAVDPEAEMIQHETLQALREALEGLPERERRVMVGRYGLDGSRPRTLRQLGAEMGLTKERIRQIELKTRRQIGCALAAAARAPENGAASSPR